MNGTGQAIGRQITSPAECREAEIPHMAKCVHEQIAELEELQKMLWQRLQRVLRQEPQSEKACANERATATELGADLNAANRKLGSINDGFRSMLHVLEV